MLSAFFDPSSDKRVFNLIAGMRGGKSVCLSLAAAFLTVQAFEARAEEFGAHEGPARTLIGLVDCLPDVFEDTVQILLEHPAFDRYVVGLQVRQNGKGVPELVTGITAAGLRFKLCNMPNGIRLPAPTESSAAEQEIVAFALADESDWFEAWRLERSLHAVSSDVPFSRSMNFSSMHSAKAPLSARIVEARATDLNFVLPSWKMNPRLRPAAILDYAVRDWERFNRDYACNTLASFEDFKALLPQVKDTRCSDAA